MFEIYHREVRMLRVSVICLTGGNVVGDSLFLEYSTDMTYKSTVNT